MCVHGGLNYKPPRTDATCATYVHATAMLCNATVDRHALHLILHTYMYVCIHITYVLYMYTHYILYVHVYTLHTYYTCIHITYYTCIHITYYTCIHITYTYCRCIDIIHLHTIHCSPFSQTGCSQCLVFPEGSCET